MSYTRYLDYDQSCKYLNLNGENAYDMLKVCIDNKTKQKVIIPPVNKTYKTNNPIDHILNDEGAIIEPFTVNNTLKEKNVSDYVKLDVCPEGYKFNTKLNGCEEVCTNCYTDVNVDPMEEACTGGYHFNGIDNDNDAICSRNLDVLNVKGLNIEQNYKLF